ncbi:LysE family translocator [Pararhodospirillum oryzae]|uniref:Lysine transporter LysE n=1 Tax=Pararhodospirillum oryzae TaxID=478448 RepID=A0A512H733_9PROT|nr:LysE family transporter [Pararhodospirillum oryzae]GEO81269.1 lysine transporter LysE [Pararhodospirillum oryzae]
MDPQTLVLFAVTSASVSLIPGPNMLYAMSLGLRHGPRRSMAGGAGMALALGLMALVSALGLGALVSTSVVAFSVLKWLGVAYLIWLGISAWRAPVGAIAPGAPGSDEARPGRLFRRGLLVTFSNPKAMVFLTALFPQFLDPHRPLVAQLTALVLVMMVLEFASIMLYASGGARLSSALARAGTARLVNRVTGGLMIGAGGLLALARRV